MDTTLVVTTAIGAIAGLTGGLGGAVIAARIQRSNERSRQRERAAEVLGSVSPLLTELEPNRMVIQIPLAELLNPGQQDSIDEAFAKLHKLDERVHAVRKELSTLTGWWSTPKGSDLAEQLQMAIFDIFRFDKLAIEFVRSRSDDHVLDAARKARSAWGKARSLADQLRAEIRGEATPIPSKLLLPAQPKSWKGPPGS
jgi:hypothetical protein